MYGTLCNVEYTVRETEKLQNPLRLSTRQLEVLFPKITTTWTAMDLQWI